MRVCVDVGEAELDRLRILLESRRESHGEPHVREVCARVMGDALLQYINEGGGPYYVPDPWQTPGELNEYVSLKRALFSARVWLRRKSALRDVPDPVAHVAELMARRADVAERQRALRAWKRAHPNFDPHSAPIHHAALDVRKTYIEKGGGPHQRKLRKRWRSLLEDVARDVDVPEGVTVTPEESP